MMRSLSLQFVWTGSTFPQRASNAACAGFDLVDLWDSRDSDVDAVAAVCADHGTGINGFFGNRDYPLCDPVARADVLEEISRSLDTAARVGACQLHMFANAIRPGGVVEPAPDLPAQALTDTCVATLREAAELVAGTGVTLVLEHLNTLFLPNYLWPDVLDAVEVARAVNHPGVRVVFDTFHQQLTGGRLTDRLVAALPNLARVDVAEVPDRHEPGAGEIDFGYLRQLLDAHGWDGTITFETVPSDGHPDTALRAIDRFFPPHWCAQPRPGKDS